MEEKGDGGWGFVRDDIFEPRCFFNVLPWSPTTPATAPLIAPIVPKNDVLSHLERRILRVRRPSAGDRNQLYSKDSDNVGGLPREVWTTAASAVVLGCACE